MSLMDKVKKLFYRKTDYYVSKRLVNTKLLFSPSNKYQLNIREYDTGKHYWNYTRGTIYDANGKEIADVKRNYSAFPYAWVEGHPNGHDYLVCGFNYQGQTIIELDTGKRKDYLPEEAKLGMGFCWAAYEPSPNRLKLAVNGCYWGGPYDIVIVDFSDPIKHLPYIEWLDYRDFFGWIDDENVSVGRWEDIRKSDGKPEQELTDEEIDEALNKDDWDEREVKHAVKLK